MHGTGAPASPCSALPTEHVDPSVSAAILPVVTFSPPICLHCSTRRVGETHHPLCSVAGSGKQPVAVASEEAFVLNTLATSDVDRYGLGGTLGVETTVLERANGGVYVRVRLGYSVTTNRKTSVNGTAVVEQSIGRSTVAATYFVSTETVRRVAGETVHR